MKTIRIPKTNISVHPKRIKRIILRDMGEIFDFDNDILRYEMIIYLQGMPNIQKGIRTRSELIKAYCKIMGQFGQCKYKPIKAKAED